ncbi:uncharacterized protein tp53i13 [Thunnus maccoyii]|uniref:uncharacterized protein tp53i13 n=1 Tax=Thunnus maccoyii TaxID=8240 RepID=UPI001C4C4AAD|nr:uncharacterized protein tp53i13 [Thunnus maccoyii]
MPSQTTSPPPLTVTVLAALWVSLGRCGVSESPGPGCDNGKLSLDRDLLRADAVYWDCPVSMWPESTQRLPSIDTVYDPEPAKPICMDKPISYSHTIPNSGAYRPIRAESGEYLYCPPQRWLNNLHHGATVLLYHPCAPLHERLLLSALARSCLPEYIITSHPQLNKHMPIALVSWGRTLELSTVASSDVCDWLETTTTTRNPFSGASQSKKYDLLLTWSAEQHRQQRAHPEEHSTKIKESLRQCCERTVSSLPNRAMEVELDSTVKDEKMNQLKKHVKRRQRRAVIRQNQVNVANENMKEDTTTQVSSFLTNQTNKTITNGTGNSQNYNSTHASSADSPPGNTTLSDPPNPSEAPAQSKIQNQSQSLTPWPTTPLGSNISEATLKPDSLGVGAFESQKHRVTLQTALQPSPAHTDLKYQNPSKAQHSEQNHTARPEALTLSSKDKGTDSTKQRDKDSTKRSMKEKNSDKDVGANRKMKDNEVVDVKEREVEHKHAHSGTHSHHINDKTGQSEPLSQHHQNPQPASYLPNTHDCDSCKAGEHCECAKGSGAEGRAAVMSKGLPRTPRTDEAVWAAAALGFLLVLLTLSVLHTRLYRHWRTTPSLYWRDPRQDYDSVADVIRRRLRIANRRRKRGRRQECVLLPSSSSSDEHP